MPAPGIRKSALLVATTLLVMALAWVNFWVVRSSNRAPDDAYISLRYADNLAAGEGFRFNPGDERVEGFSSPTHVLTMGLMIRAGLEPLAVSQATSLAGALLAVVVTFWWGSRRLGLFWGTLAALAVAWNPGVSTWARGGLETSGFTLAVLLILVLGAERRWRSAALAAGLAAVTRPEGVLYGAVLVVYAVLVTRADGRSLRRLVPAAGIGLLAGLPWLVFRVIYFGDWLPNTYYAKMDGVRAEQLDRGLEYLGSFLATSEIAVAAVLAAIGGGVVLARGGGGSRLARAATWPVLGVGLLAAAGVFVLGSGGDWMANHRFLVPVVPVLVLLAAASGRRLAELAGRPFLSAPVAALLGLVFISQPARIFSHDLRHPTYPLDRPLGLVEPWDDSIVPNLYRFGEALGRIVAEDETIALVPVGAAAYASGRRVLDMMGLNDREIAHLPVPDMGRGQMGHEKGDGPLILARAPDFLVLRHNPNPAREDVAPPDTEMKYNVVRQLWEDPAFHAAYEPFSVRIDEALSFTVYRRVSSP